MDGWIGNVDPPTSRGLRFYSFEEKGQEIAWKSFSHQINNYKETRAILSFQTNTRSIHSYFKQTNTLH